MKKLPLGIQTFKDIINYNNIYVDKTKYIYKLLESSNKYFFLSRPRRFGKSLLISTLEEIFLGNKELFKDLYIYDKIEWKKYPIIRMDFSSLNLETPDKLRESLLLKIKEISLKYNISLNSNDYKLSFEELIRKLSDIGKVVILVDEYDKPIIDFVDNLEIVEENRKILKNFYVTLKSCDEFIKFVFLTGVSKFSKISIFSGLNNLKDITLDKNYSTMLGYTQSELEFYFEDWIDLLAKENKFNIEEIKKILKDWYNGYSWDGKNFVYNPFSILNVLDDKTINNYWFKSGTPTLLTKLIKDKNVNIETLENFVASDELLDSFEIDNIKVESLLFQTGYLTIKNIDIKKIGFKKYYLNYPNIEVKESLLSNILNEFSFTNDSRVLIANLIDYIENNELIKFFETLQYSIFAQIPNEIFISNKESYYHTIIYLTLTLIGVQVKTEVHTNKGRIDAIIETTTHIYILEFKMSSTKSALKQIENKKYYESFILSAKEIILVGVSFDINERNIKDWQVKNLKEIINY